MKPCLKNRNGKSAYIKIFSELPLTDKEVCRCYVPLNTTSYYWSYTDFKTWATYISYITYTYYTFIWLLHHILIFIIHFSARFSFLHKDFFSIQAREHEYIFSKYSWNLNILEIYWACYMKNNFPLTFPKHKKPCFLASIKI